jgi:hypothetical protein
MPRTLLAGTRVGLGGVLLGLGLIIGGEIPVRAGSSFDFLFHADSARTDTQFFLNLTVGDYGFRREELEPLLPRIREVEIELPVVLYLARESRRPVAEIIDLRSSGLDWSSVFTRVGCAQERLFAGIDRDPGPPYGKAWGYRRKHGGPAQLADDDVRGLVQIQIGQRFSGLSPYELAQARGRGLSVERLVADRKGRRGRGSDDDDEDDQGRGRGKGKGHKKEKDKDRDRDRQDDL